MLSALAPAKVNLFLHVGPAKMNGRHDLDSLVVFADHRAADILTVSAADALSLSLSGEGASSLAGEADNLVLRAARALQAASGCTRGASIMLDKRLPVAAGIGGGSADAAAALHLLTQLWEIDPSHAARIAPSLGGDVPVALGGVTAFMRGEGERVEPARHLPPLHAVLVNPNVPCPTGEVFETFDLAGDTPQLVETTPPLAHLSPSELIDWLAGHRNALVIAAIDTAPVIADLLEALADTDQVRLTRMSGSGATCFALYHTEEQASSAARRLQDSHPGWWVRATQLGTELASA